MIEKQRSLEPKNGEDQEAQAADGSGVRSYPRHIPHLAIVRAPGLLPMWYRRKELAEVLEVDLLFIRDWMRRGLAFRRDVRGNIWIEGNEASRWIDAHRRSGSKRFLADGEAYCFRCRARVEMARPVKRVAGKHVVLSGICPRCQGKVNRGVRNGPPRELPSG